MLELVGKAMANLVKRERARAAELAAAEQLYSDVMRNDQRMVTTAQKFMAAIDLLQLGPGDIGRDHAVIRRARLLEDRMADVEPKIIKAMAHVRDMELALHVAQGKPWMNRKRVLEAAHDQVTLAENEQLDLEALRKSLMAELVELAKTAPRAFKGTCRLMPRQIKPAAPEPQPQLQMQIQPEPELAAQAG